MRHQRVTFPSVCCRPAGLLFYCFRIYATKGELSSSCEEFLVGWSQFDSDHGVDFSAPTCCQSATFVRPLLRFIVRCFLRKNNNPANHNATLHFMPRMNAVFAHRGVITMLGCHFGKGEPH